MVEADQPPVHDVLLVRGEEPLSTGVPESIPQPDVLSTWIRAIAENRDTAAFIALFSGFAPRVKGYLVRLGLHETLAEELTQETFLTIWRKAGQFDPARASAGAWIYTIARNRRIDALRRETPPRDGRMGEQFAEPATPEHQLNASQDERRVRAAMERLPAEQAVVLRLSFFDDLTHAQIAADLGLPLGTVKSRIRLASAHLRHMMEDPS